MRSSILLSRIALGLYLLIFFSYLLGPLVIMSMTAFNSNPFPSVSPWDCFTFEWFRELANDERILRAILNSVIIGLGTVVLSVAMGLSASLLLTQIRPRWRSTYYTIIIAPILIPGVVLGISTVVFWDRLSRILGPATDTLFHNGIFLTILGQSTFIASYTMLVFVARLQRYDPGLTEAALDLGATHVQAFRKILLPFMRPAIASAAVLAFLASFENYNTTTFTFGRYPTLTIELAQKVRYGINPSISALAFIIVALTVFGALANEAWRRGRIRAGAARKEDAAPQRRTILPAFLRGNWAAVALVLLSFAAITLFWTARTYSPEQCKAEVRAAKQAEAARRREELLRRREEMRRQQQMKGPDIFAPSSGKPAAGAGGSTGAPATGNAPFGGVFDPGNLEGQSGTGGKPGAGTTTPDEGTAPFGSVFDPGNLKGQAGTQGKPDQGSQAEPPAKPSPFGSVFDPGNLANQAGAGGETESEKAPPDNTDESGSEKPAPPPGSVFDPENLKGVGGTAERN